MGLSSSRGASLLQGFCEHTLWEKIFLALFFDPASCFPPVRPPHWPAKNRTDVQENQLLKGMLPGDVLYGVELPKSEGRLTTVDSNGLTKQEEIEAEIEPF